ncbi:MAG: DMT family transporter [Sulfurimonas sp.]|uniref:DMT family transporter n=1 Tax=Sulfurimonas sp. TaxID=2022749 RepID=UPI00261CF84B|nr:DMT family transporter [Sulfurimonas sp.]MCW8895754.1 DMT family transporter [Sulfurimonas sp.]MCW8953437.1 DMT family transporter [Sulfurimonas sp.]MCW9067047.1 DMT family transporter [Sulfurimonas sp.]
MLSKIDRGVLYMLAGALISAMNGALTKILANEMSALEIVFFRNLLGVALILYALKHTAPKLSGGKFYMLISRGVYGFLAMILFFYTITVIPLGEAITLNKTSPLFVSILAYYLLKEHLSFNTIFALIIGFLGIILIVKPLGFSISYAHFLGILGGFFAAAAYTTIKKIKDIYDSRIIVLSFVGIGTILPALGFLLAPYVDAPEAISFMFPIFSMPDTMYVWSLIIFMGLISTLSQWLLTKAYSASKVSIIGVISYANIPFAVGFGWMLGDALPDMYTYMGIGLIIIGGILVSKK